jgi:YfiH family protein
MQKFWYTNSSMFEQKGVDGVKHETEFEPLQLQEAEGVTWFRYDGWERVNVGFSSRLGGVSRAPFATLNLALHVADEDDTVIANRRLLAKALHIEPERWVCAEQVHGNNVLAVERAQCAAGLLRREDALPDADGMMTNDDGVWLTSFYADCVPLYFYDPVHRVIATAHAGWRGTVADIVGEVLRGMVAKYGSDVREVRGLIGPAIGACCYEVDEQVRAAVAGVLADDENHQDGDSSKSSKGVSALARVCKPSENGQGKYKLDLKRCNQMLMMKAGMLPQHIESSQYCTCCRSDLFFSHRGEQGKTGRMAAWMYMHETT